MNSYLFWLSIIDIICVVGIIVVYEIRLGRMKELIKELQDEVIRMGPNRFNAAYENVKDISIANPIQLDEDLASIMEEAQKKRIRYHKRAAAS